MPVVCSANCLQPYRQNDNGRDQGLLFLTPSRVWGQPPYYVTQMISRNYLPLCVACDFDSPAGSLDATAKRSQDGRAIQLQVVNVEDRPIPASIVVEGFSPRSAAARVVELSGRLEAIHRPDDPNRVIPRSRDWDHRMRDGRATYTFPPHSFTILRFE